MNLDITDARDAALIDEKLHRAIQRMAWLCVALLAAVVTRMLLA